MTDKEVINWCEDHLAKNDYLSFPEEMLDVLSDGNIQAVIDKYGTKYLMKMPQSEVQFFEWLKINDLMVWKDLWEGEEEPYLVAVNFLPLLLSKIRGFPICDLLDNDNYFFTDEHLISDEAKLMRETVRQMYMDHKQLTVEQALILEISIEPIDIWRYAYRYNLSVERAKKAVQNLVGEKMLLHIKDAEQLSGFITF
ncbi:hypothetical protein D9V86_06135 [Bacteroidetes/Chlorobi group bacterium ChocPot_Mid]|jgi:hypothetical protein|nr:MAG: hypothetical protein D9V86_06135 [Bacteroidetes/Chlorobi group bacterium ChocPot_Mid]